MEHIEDNQIRTTAISFSFGEILSLHSGGEIVIRPEYQRLFRWTDEQRSRFIESILLELPIPPIFFFEIGNGALELIDGLQRTYSVLQFLNHQAIEQDELALRGCSILKELNGQKIGDFNTTDRFRLKRYSIRAIIIRNTGNEFLKYSMFKRLNSGGYLLSPQEFRNCSAHMVSGGAEFYKVLQELAADRNFITVIDQLPRQDIDSRVDEELVLRFFAVRAYRDKFSGNVREWLDNFMEDALFWKTKIAMNPDDFKDFFAFAARKFGNTAFSRFQDGHPIGRLEPAYFEAVSGALKNGFEALEDTPSDQLKQKLIGAFENQIFKETTDSTTDSKYILEQRIECIRAALFG